MGAREPVDLKATFERRFGEGVGVYFETVESQFSDITPGTEKRVIWAGARETRTPVSIVYIHGFSATSEEIRPVPDQIAQALGANLVYTRLAGHGRGAAAMAEPTVNDWMQDMAEALAAGRQVGERVVVVGTSTGATLMVAAARDPEMVRDVAGFVMVSPNFGINHPLSALLTWPWARHWLPVIGGRTASFEPRNGDHERYWTTRYPSVAVLPLAALVKEVMRTDFGQIKIPALFRYSKADQVVRPDITARVAADWAGPSAEQIVDVVKDDDPMGHVIAGDIVSPGGTDAAVSDILNWLRSEGI